MIFEASSIQKALPKGTAGDQAWSKNVSKKVFGAGGGQKMFLQGMGDRAGQKRLQNSVVEQGWSKSVFKRFSRDGVHVPAKACTRFLEGVLIGEKTFLGSFCSRSDPTRH